MFYVYGTSEIQWKSNFEVTGKIGPWSWYYGCSQIPQYVRKTGRHSGPYGNFESFRRSMLIGGVTLDWISFFAWDNFKFS